MAEQQKLDRYGFTPPANRQGRGVDPRVLEVIGEQSFKADVPASSGLDDRRTSNSCMQRAQKLMADAVGADRTFFSSCDSSLAVKAAMLAVTHGEGEILTGRDAHRSVVSALVLRGLQPRWIRPSCDSELKLAHPPTPREVEAMWEKYLDASAALIVCLTRYGAW